MPSFKHTDSLRFWFDYTDPMVYRVITFMESMEDWTTDDNDEVNSALQKLGHAMEDLGDNEIAKEETFMKLITFLKLSRMLHILQTIDTARPGSASGLLSYAEKNSTSSQDLSGLFLRRNVIFERLRLLSRLFSKGRIALVQQALEDEDVE